MFGDRREFRLPGTPVRYPPDRVADISHVRLELRVDPEKETLRGTATHRLSPIGQPLRRLPFDLVGLTVDGVTSGGRDLRFHHEGGVLDVYFDRAVPVGRELEVAIAYHGTPVSGLNFNHPDRDHPNRGHQAWSQGQDEYSRYWFPGHDFPNQRSTTEVIVSAPARYDTVSNGRLLSTRVKGQWKTWHWSQEEPHVIYLVTLVIGRFERWEETVNGLLYEYLVPPGRKADGLRAFKDTPEMVRVFTELAGTPYPWARYAQVVVEDFTWGGMENTSATTYIDDMLPDSRAYGEYDHERLVSHELAHQWFGDLVTCREWAHAWLNEGFATYAHPYWAEVFHGWEEGQRLRAQHLQLYFQEDARYRRPIVSRTYQEPTELFDRHLYEKAGLVLWMLRRVLGDEVFHACVHEYVRRHRDALVVTEDLVRAFEDVSGRSLGWFFDQWIFGGGHPEFQVGYSWDDATGTAGLSVRQRQKLEAPTPLFRAPLEVAFGQQGKPPVIHRIEVGARGEADDGFTFALPARPTWVRFDRENSVVKTLDFERAEELLLGQLDQDEMTGRAEAARALGRKATPRAVAALDARLGADEFWYVQAEAARGLGDAGTNAARDSLLRALSHSNPRVRTAAAGALEAWHEDDDVARGLARTLRSDRSYYAVGAAASSLGRVGARNADAALTRALAQPSQRDVVALGAVRGLRYLGGERQLDTILIAIRTRPSWRLRSGAVVEAARLARRLGPEARTRVRELGERLLRDDNYFVRRAAAGALMELGDRAAIPALRATVERDVEGGVRQDAREAIDALQRGDGREQEVKALREELEQLRRREAETRSRVDQLEAAASRRGRAR